MPASSRRTSRHRTSPRRTSIWRGGSSRPWCRYRSWYRYRPCCPRRVPCRCGLWPRRCDHSNAARGLVRLVRCGSIVARAVVGRGLRIVGAARAGALSWVRLSLLLAAVLLSTSAAKLSFPADGSESGRADLAAAVWKDAFADTSDVTLTTGDPRAELSATIQQGPGHPPRQKILIISILTEAAEITEHDCDPLFCPAARFAVLEPLQNGDRLIASREYGLY